MKQKMLIFLKGILYLSCLVCLILTVASAVSAVMTGVKNGIGKELWAEMYSMLVVGGIAVILYHFIMVSGSEAEVLSPRSVKHLSAMGYGFLFESSLEVMRCNVGTRENGWMEVLNVNISLLLVVFLLNTVMFLAMAEYLEKFLAYKEDNELTI